MRININFKEFLNNHSKKKHQSLFRSRTCNDYSKVENFVIIVNSIGVDFQAKPMDIILPMGISFYTFQTMSYTIDMYKRKTEINIDNL